MTSMQLGEIRRDMYHNAGTGNAVVMIHLLGIKHADDIRASGATPIDIARAARINGSYSTEIKKGVRLAELVDVRPSV